MKEALSSSILFLEGSMHFIGRQSFHKLYILNMLKYLKIISTFFIFLILICTSAFAEGGYSIANIQLSLDECIGLIKSRNNQYSNTKLVQDARKAFLERERTSLNPKLNYSIIGSDEQFLGVQISPSDVFKNIRNVLTITKTLFPNRAIRENLIEASLDYDNSKLLSKLKFSEIIFLIKGIYWKLCVFSKLQNIEKQRIEYLSKVCEIEENRRSLGLASNFEIKSAHLQKDIAENDLLKTKEEFESNMKILKDLIGKKSNIEIKLVDSLPIPDDNINLEAADVKNILVADLFPIKIIGNEISRNMSRVKYAKRQYWPHMKFTVGNNDDKGNFYSGSLDNDWNLSLSSSRPIHPGAGFNTTETNFVGFSISYDFLDGGYSVKSEEY